MTIQEVKKLILKKENAKLDFKREWTYGENKNDKKRPELYKDIIALTNGHIDYIGQPSYLIIGIKEARENLPMEIHNIDFDVEKLEKEIIQNLQNYAQPSIQDVKISKYFIDNKNIYIIKILPHPYPIVLTKNLKPYTVDDLLLRAGEGTIVPKYETRRAFTETMEKYRKKKNLKFIFWGIFFLFLLFGVFYIYSQTQKQVDYSTTKSVLLSEWDEEKAEKIVLKEMIKYEKIKKNNFGFRNKISHKIIRFSELNDINYHNPKKIAIIETSDYIWCHACGVQLSFIEFIHVQSGWILGQIHINIIQAGSWGENNDTVEVLPIGKNKFAVTLQGFYGNHGIFSDYFTLYILVAGEYTRVFSTEVSTSNAGAVEENDMSYYSWDANITFKEDKNLSYYDLIVLKEGIRDKIKFKEQTLYRFDGIEYKEIATTAYKID